MEWLFGMIWKDPKRNHARLYKNKSEGDLTQTEEEEVLWPWKHSTVIWPQPKERQQPLVTGRDKEHVVPLNLQKESSPDNTFTLTLSYWLQTFGLQNWEKINVCDLKSPTLW